MRELEQMTAEQLAARVWVGSGSESAAVVELVRRAKERDVLAEALAILVPVIHGDEVAGIEEYEPAEDTTAWDNEPGWTLACAYAIAEARLEQQARDGKEAMEE